MIEKFIKSSTNSIGQFSVEGKMIEISSPLPNNVDAKRCFQHILGRMPRFFCSNVERFMIGNFDFLQNREIDGIYKQNTIWITNNQESDETLIADIMHEIAHSFEESYKEELYSDSLISDEFLQKRTALYRKLEMENLIPEQVKKEDFYNLNYSLDFDEFLYKYVGYSKLSGICRDIFISPYAATSLREYFANAFENFFVNDIFIVKTHCPAFYEKITNFLEF